MSPEERQELIAALRRKADTGAVRVPICGEAAEEIERLAAMLKDYRLTFGVKWAQPDAEPCKICGGSGQIRYLGPDNSEEVEDCSCRLAQSDAEPTLSSQGRPVAES